MIAESLDSLAQTLVTALPGIISGLAVIAGFWIAARVLRSMVRRMARHLDPDRASLAGLAADTGYWTLLILGFISGFGTMGVNVAGLVAGLGLTGFALGFALRDAVSNLLAGVLILIFRPFHVGSDIKVAGYSGTVLAIDLRYTTLSGDGRYVLVPNKTMYTSPITVIGEVADGVSGDQAE
jgi:small-conductance mechanosensitive channel